MTLDDFFKQKKEAPNYVAADLGDDFSNSPLTQALKTGDPKVKVSQGRGPINVFGTVKTTAATVEPEVAKVAQEAPKVPEEVSNEIQAKFAPSPFAGSYLPPEAPQEQTSSREELSQFTSSMAPEATWSDVLMGLIPVAADALSGGYGDALDVSGKYYSEKASGIEKRKQTLEDKLLDIEKSRAIAAAKAKGSLKTPPMPTTSNIVPVTGPDGRVTYKWVADAIDKEKPLEKSAASNREEIARLAREQQMSLANRKLLTDTRDKLNGNKTFQAARARYQATNDAIDVLNQKNPIGDAGVPMLFAKGIFGEVGNLTAQEQARFIGSPELTNAFSRMYKKYSDGEAFTAKDRNLLMRLAEHMRTRAKQIAEAQAQAYIKGIGSMGVDASGIINPLLEDTASVSPEYMAEEEERSSYSNRAMNPAQNKAIIQSRQAPSNSGFSSFEDWKKSKGYK
jgi:hypothetical protein